MADVAQTLASHKVSLASLERARQSQVVDDIAERRFSFAAPRSPPHMPTARAPTLYRAAWRRIYPLQKQTLLSTYSSIWQS